MRVKACACKFERQVVYKWWFTVNVQRDDVPGLSFLLSRRAEFADRDEDRSIRKRLPLSLEEIEKTPN